MVNKYKEIKYILGVFYNKEIIRKKYREKSKV